MLNFEWLELELWYIQVIQLAIWSFVIGVEFG
jgi:hypothetical protein